MEKPFKFIECKILQRDEFYITEGHQPTCALFYIKEGSFSLKIGKEQSIISAGDCVIFMDNVNFLRSVVEPISFISFKFKINEKCPFTFPMPYGKIHLKNLNRFKDSIEKYESLMNVEDARAIYYREHLMEDLLLQVFADVNDNEVFYSEDSENVEFALQKCNDKVVSAVAQYIHDNIDKKLKNEDICRAFGTNASTLNFKFRREIKMSVGDFIIRERMRVARHLLINTTFSITDISAKCGYDNEYYFSTAFKKQNGIPPSLFRTQYR